MNQRKVALIPIELKNRELHSHLLLASRLAMQGYRIFVGSHAAIFRLLKNKNFKASLYLDKGSQPESTSKMIRERVDFMGILDQELSPILSKSSNFRESNIVASRFYPNTKEFVDFYFTVGPLITNEANMFFGKNKVIETGWPRFDLLHDKYSSIYESKVKTIKKVHGEFDLFISNFSLIREINYMRSNANIGNFTLVTKEFDEAWWKENFDSLERFIQVIRDWRSKGYRKKFVIRPHLTESLRAWKEITRGIDNIEFHKKDDIFPWIMAADRIFHRGSTVSLQSGILGKKPYFIEECSINASDEIYAKFSTVINREFIPDSTPEKPEMIVSKENFGELIRLPKDDDFAVDKISQYFSTLPLEHYKSQSPLRFCLSSVTSLTAWRRCLGLARDEIKSLAGMPVGMTQLQAIPWGITSIDAHRFFQKLYGNNSKENKIKVTQTGINLIKIESH